MPLPQAPALALSKSGTLDPTVVAPANQADPGDEVDYTLTATNTGNVTLTGVTITDPKLGALACTPSQPATLAPGAQIVCTGSYTLTQADLDSGQVVNTATGDTDQTPPTQSTETVPLPQAPALTLVKQGTIDTTVVLPNARADAGDRIDYTLTATNTGNVTLTGVTVTDPKLGTLVCAPAQPATLLPGEHIVCTGSYTLTQADLNTGQVQNTGTADSNQTPPTQAPSTVPVPQSPALALLKQGTLDTTVVAPGNRPDAGDKITYTLTAVNVGNVTLTGVTISDPKLGTLVCTPPQPATLAPGATLVCTGTYTLTQADLNGGQVQNTATGDSDQTPPTDRIETVPLPQVPVLALSKRGTLDMAVVAPNDRADVGDKITYTLTALNAGNVTLTGVTISDPKLGTLACTPSQPATLAPGATLVCTGSYTLTQPDLNSGQVENTATADSDQTPPSERTETVPLPQVPALTLAKVGTVDTTVVAPDNRADVGDTIVYALTATNVGNVTLTGVTVTDPKLGTLVCIPPPAGDAPARRQARVRRRLHAHPGGPERRRREQHRDRRQRPDPAGRDDGDGAAAAGSGAGARQGGNARHGRRGAGHPRGRRRQGELHADGDERRQRHADRRDDQRPEARDARVHAVPAGDPCAGRQARVHGHLHADPGRREQRPRHQHGDGRQRPDPADERARAT